MLSRSSTFQELVVLIVGAGVSVGVVLVAMADMPSEGGAVFLMITSFFGFAFFVYFTLSGNRLMVRNSVTAGVSLPLRSLLSIRLLSICEMNEVIDPRLTPSFSISGTYSSGVLPGNFAM